MVGFNTGFISAGADFIIYDIVGVQSERVGGFLWRYPVGLGSIACQLAWTLRLAPAALLFFHLVDLISIWKPMVYLFLSVNFVVYFFNFGL